MGLFFIYILKSGTALILFYLFYKLLLSRETFHRFNRITLLLLLTVASVLPFFQWKKELAEVHNGGLIDLSQFQIQTVAQDVAAKSIPGILYILLFIYLTGVFFFICHTLLVYIQLYRYIHSQSGITLENGVRLILTGKDEAPFSWMNYVIMSKADWEESGKEILTHENGHIHLRHSWDRMLTQVCIIFHWFNPAVWLIRQELEHIHEYEADDYVLNKGINAKRYQLLLIKKAVGSQRFTSMANSFNHSKLKKRITMMLKVKSNPWARFRFALFLPVALLVVNVYGNPEITDKLNVFEAIKISEFIPNEETVMPDKDKLSQAGIDKIVQESLKDAQERLKEIDIDKLVEEKMKEVDWDEINEKIKVAEEKLKDLDIDKLVEEKMKEVDWDEINEKIKVAEEKLKDLDIDKLVEDKMKEAEEKVKEAEIKMQMVDVKVSEAQRKEAEAKVKVEEHLQHVDDQLKKVDYKISGDVTSKLPVSVTMPYPSNERSDIIHIIIDGKEGTQEQLDAIEKSTTKRIESVSVYKDQHAIDKYGEKAVNGVIEVITSDVISGY